MTIETLAAALEREHHDIDAGVAAFLAGRRDLDALTRAIEALRRHIFLEEEFLFPPLRDAGLVAPVFVMLREHGEIWRTLDILQAQLDADADARPDPEVCDLLVAQLERHNFKEEAIIYPQADAVLSAGASVGLRAFLEAGQRPDGWVCAERPREPQKPGGATA